MDDNVLPKDLMNIVMEYAAPREDQEWCDKVFSVYNLHSKDHASFQEKEQWVYTRLVLDLERFYKSELSKMQDNIRRKQHRS